jgi:hypothetical protein
MPKLNRIRISRVKVDDFEQEKWKKGKNNWDASRSWADQRGLESRTSHASTRRLRVPACVCVGSAYRSALGCAVPTAPEHPDFGCKHGPRNLFITLALKPIAASI